MKWWPFRKRQSKERVVVDFPPDIWELPILKYHGLRALCGALMDRHTACRSPHPFCGLQGHWKEGDRQIPLIAHAIPQVRADTGAPLVAVYLCRATNKTELPPREWMEPVEYAYSLTYHEEIPFRKLVVSLVDDGTYIAQYGPIVNPVEGDYSTGSIDQDNLRTLYCNPEPAHVHWQYADSTFSEGQGVVPEFRCLNAFGQWWILDVDREKRKVEQVASLEWADNPEHNFGIHKPGGQYYINNNDGSERSKVLNENLPRTDGLNLF